MAQASHLPRMQSPRLAPEPSLGSARAILQAYQPRDESQAQLRERMCAFLAQHPSDALLRSCLPGHFTAASLLVDRARGKALLTHHKKLNRWLQFGGHCDGDANFAHVAWRETFEESGIAAVLQSEQPIDLDIHTIPARLGEPEHLHLDVRYLTEAPPHAQAVPSSESWQLQWFGPHEIAGLDLDDSVLRLFRLAFT